MVRIVDLDRHRLGEESQRERALEVLGKMAAQLVVLLEIHEKDEARGAQQILTHRRRAAFRHVDSRADCLFCDIGRRGTIRPRIDPGRGEPGMRH